MFSPSSQNLFFPESDLPVPTWPISLNSLEGVTIGNMGDLFESSEFCLDLEASTIPKRKEFAGSFPSSKRSKSELGAPIANVIASDELLNEDDLLALSDALSGESSDSFDEESMLGEESGDESLGSGDEEEDAFYGEDAGELAGKPKPNHDSKKSRGNYACSKCGMAKRGHVCALQPRMRRRNGSVSVPVPSGVFPAPRIRTTAVKTLRALKPTVAPTLRCESGSGPSAAYSFVCAPSPKMVCTASQCELEAGNTIRELYVDAQGFPESYMSGILCDPSFNLANARTITVSRPTPKAYKPRNKVMSSMGSGPDCMAMAPSSFAHPASMMNDPLGLMRMGPLGMGMGMGMGGPLALNHLALLMNSFQHNLAQSGMHHGMAGMQHGMMGHSGEIDPALASLFFPMAAMPQPLARRET